MNEFLLNVHFLRPEWLAAIIPAILLGASALRNEAASGQWKEVVNPKLLPFLMDGQIEKSRRWPIILAAIVAVITSIALAGPAWKKIPQPVAEDVSGLVLIWDLSPSMNAQDITPSRLVRSRLKIIDLLNKRKEGTTGLIVYSGESHIASPLTDDTNTIVNLMGGLSPGVIPLKGSNPEMAFEQAIGLLKNAGVTDGSIIFITDGIDYSAFDTLEQLANKTSHKVTIWGIGTAEGAPIPLSNGGFARDKNGDILLAHLDDSALEDLAINLGGLYVPFSNGDTDIFTISSFGFNSSSNKVKETLKEFDQWHEEGLYLVLLILPLFALAFRRGWIICLCFVIFATTPEKSFALEWKDLWETQNQQGMKLLNNENPAEAAKYFTDETWKSIAQYHAGDYDSAEKGFAQDKSAKGLLNKGNAQVHQKKYDEAIASYQKALEHNSEFVAAKDNLKIAKALKALEEQQPQEQNQEQNQEQEGEQQKNEQQKGEQKKGEQQSNKNGQQGQNKQENAEGNQNQEDNTDNTAGEQKELNEEQKQAMEDTYGSEPEKEEQAASDSKKQQGEKEQDERDQKIQQAHKNREQEPESPNDTQQGVAISEEVRELSELEQAKEQWLRKIPDDPSGLLRKKFEYEYRKRRQEIRQQQWQYPDNNANERW